MNRRNFIGGLLAAAAGFTILPGAGRVWKAVITQRMVVPNPAYANAPYEISFMGFRAEDYAGEWCFVPAKTEETGAGPFPLRFDSAPSSVVWTNRDAVDNWIRENSIPPFKTL